ncbi:MAG: response regulator, partial [Deltaproteobacteria bacterium]|nr:response regulator [Deltaproteobacteria bacterium]
MSLKILTVDDSKTIRMIVKKAFKSFDCEIFEAENGQEGLKEAGKIKPDLIVLDITMPVMNGIEMLGKLKEDPELKEIPVIMLTAESGKDNVMQIVKMGVKNYIVKPFKGEQLIERAESVVSLKKKPEKDGEDQSAKYFSLDGDIVILSLPVKITRPVTVEIEGLLSTKTNDMAKSGMNKIIMDMSKVTETNMSLIKLIISVTGTFQKASIYIRVVGTSGMEEELKGFAETSEIPIRH